MFSNIYQMINIMWQLYKYKKFMCCLFCLQKSNKLKFNLKISHFLVSIEFLFYLYLSNNIFFYFPFKHNIPLIALFSFFFILYPPHHNHPHFTLLYCLLYFCLLNWYYILVYLKFQNGPMHSQRQIKILWSFASSMTKK